MHRISTLRRVFVPVLLLALVAGIGSAGSVAADPPSATIGPSDPSVSWEGPAMTAVTDGPSDGECTAINDPLPDGFCDDFTLSVTGDVDEAFWAGHAGGIDITLAGYGPDEDFDFYVYDGAGAEVASSGNPGGVELGTIECPTAAAGPYRVRVVYFATIDEGAGLPGYTAQADFSATSGTSSCSQSGAEGGPAFFQDNALSFAPATIVSAHYLGSEPQVTMERRLPQTPAEAGLDPNRIFIDWPLSSRSGTGQLNRSLDGGDTFRLLFDRLCASRNRPNCGTGGGGDTETEVNLVSGGVFFADQEVLANEALASSFDHGDSFTTQTAVANGTTGTDRQWIAATDNSATLLDTGRAIEGFLVYHVAPNHYVQAIDSTGLPIPQPVPQLHDVAQSGQLRVDNNLDSPGHGWIYQPYIGFLNSGTYVATAPSDGYALEINWQANKAAASSPTSFPWVAIDHAGNAYLVWDTGGAIYYTYSDISQAANNPALGGRPGTAWSPRVRISPPGVGSAVFPEVTAGDAGRIAVVFDGTTEFTGIPDDAPADTRWNTYAVVITDALAAQPHVASGVVSHRYIHRGDICTGGLGCTTNLSADRSLLDMIDVSFDEAGRVGVVFTDNYSSFGEVPNSQDVSPFTHFAKQTRGPSVLSSVGSLDVSIPQNTTADAQGDATWPNVAGAANLPALDMTGASISLDSDEVVARIGLAEASQAAMARDLAAYKAAMLDCVPITSCMADRLQYVLRFSSATEIYHLSAEYSSAGLHFFGGMLDDNDKLALEQNPTGTYGAGYHTDAGYPVTGSIIGSQLVLRAPAAAFNLSQGTPLFSVTGFAMAGPSEETELLVSRTMRTVDATRPFDATLSAVTGGANLVVSDITTVENTGTPHKGKQPKAGDKVVIRATVTNTGTAEAAASTTAVSLDGEPLPGSPVETPAIPAGGSVQVDIAWDTRTVKDAHVIEVVADAGNAVAESDEGDNAATLQVRVRGNKVTNGDFETANPAGDGPDAWEPSDGAGSTGYSESAGSDGSAAVTITGDGRSVALAGMPTWSSAPIEVSPGSPLELQVSVLADGLSSAPGVGLAYLGPAGQLLSTVRLLEVPLSTDGFATLSSTVDLPAGVAQVRVLLLGFSPTDLHTAGTVVFDEVGLFE